MVEKVVWCQMLPYIKGGEVHFLFYRTLSVAYHQNLATINAYLFDYDYLH